MLLNIMLDTMIYDYLVTKPIGSELVTKLTSLIAQGKVEIITTHVQDDEISLTPNAEFLAKILNVMNQFPRRRVPTAGMDLDVSRLGEFRLSDETTGKLLRAVRTDNGNHSRDALIGGTANLEADILVTDDKRLTRRLQAVGVKCGIWTFDQLYNYVISA